MKAYFLWLAKFITILVVICVVIPLLVCIAIGAARTITKHSGASLGDSDHQVAVVELTGVIESSKDIVQQLYEQAADPKIQGIVLRIDSPGGAVGPSQEIYDTVRAVKIKKPIVVSMGTVAASGGFYAALPASKIYCEPGTLTGSIGVIFEVPNFTKIAEKFGFDMITIKSGKFKDVGNSFREMTPEDRQFLQTTVQTVYEDFLNAVVKSRNLDRAKVLEFADGRVIVGSDAKKLGIVDDFGTVYDAARSVYDLLGTPLPKGELPKLVYPDDTFADFKKILKSMTSVVMSFNPMMPKAQMEYLMQ